MSPSEYNEDNLVQKTTADYLEQELQWESKYAYNQEDFGPDSLLGRTNDQEVVLTRYLKDRIQAFNPDRPPEAYDQAVRAVVEYSSALHMMAINLDKYKLLKDGVEVQYRNDKGERVKERLKLMDYLNPKNNHFLVVRELWIRGELYRRRADLVGFVNGIPLVFIEVKAIHRNLKSAFDDNISDYKDTIPHIFHHNAMIIVGNGVKAKVGSLSSRWEHFNEWKRLSEGDAGVVDMATLLNGLLNKENLIDMVENFILYDQSSGKIIKIVARNHQYLGVNLALEAVKDRKNRAGKLGVFWHTQGSGKSYSMVFFTQKVHRKLGGNYTFLICTDREDLDSQIYGTFSGTGIADNNRAECRARDGRHLVSLLEQHRSYIFTLIQKFNQDVNPDEGLTDRDDIIVISDEAHRSQYGLYALNMRNALPKASFIGFTGTPLFKEDEITSRVFGNYVSTYDFQRAVEDEATVPLYFDARGDCLGISVGDLNEKIAAKIEELDLDDINAEQKLERELKREYHILTAEKRLTQVAQDFVEHYSIAWENGKAMMVCIDKVTCVRMHKLIQKKWDLQIQKLDRQSSSLSDEQEFIHHQKRIAWMKNTQIAVMVSEEQGEVAKFKNWDLDIKPYRKLIKEGFALEDGSRLNMEQAFKREDHPFRVVIVCAMWLTGFDVPSLSTLYLDKPLKAHTLMQAIARANRVNEGKNNGLIVDYCGILKHLRQALATFSGQADDGRGGKDGNGDVDPTRPKEELIQELEEAIELVKAYLNQHQASLDDVMTLTGFERNAAIEAAKEVANQNDESRKRFEVMCRQVFKKFKSCINIIEVNIYRKDYEAINVIYKTLQKDREESDISHVLRELHKVVDASVDTVATGTNVAQNPAPYDISRIDFERLRQEFAHSPRRNTTVQNLRQVIENRLRKLLAMNPARTNFQKHYEQIVEDYNKEKDRVTIEQSFEALLILTQELSQEESRAVREGLDEESLAIFDLLKKPALNKKEIASIKQISKQLLETLKTEKLTIDHWRDKESTRDAVRQSIHDFLYDANTGLPFGVYTDDDVESKASDVFQHVFRVYPKLPSPFYASA